MILCRNNAKSLFGFRMSYQALVFIFACRLTLENLQSEFGEINSSVKEVDKVLQSSPEEMQKQFLSFIKVQILRP